MIIEPGPVLGPKEAQLSATGKSGHTEVVLLNEALASSKPSQAELLERLRRLRSSVVLPPNVPDSTVLLREDRER